MDGESTLRSWNGAMGGSWNGLEMGLRLGDWSSGVMIGVGNAETDARASFEFCA